jgi:hypothetical protein
MDTHLVDVTAHYPAEAGISIAFRVCAGERWPVNETRTVLVDSKRLEELKADQFLRVALVSAERAADAARTELAKAQARFELLTKERDECVAAIAELETRLKGETAKAAHSRKSRDVA